MSKSYRLNVRFDLEDEAQRRAVEYLTGLDKSRNRFIVEAVISFIERQNSDRDFTLEDVRQVIREELLEVSFVNPAPVAGYMTAKAELSEEQQAENDENVLADLTAFF